MRAAAWVADDAGALSQVLLGEVAVSYAPGGDPGAATGVGEQPTTHTLAGELPGPGRWRLVAVDLLVGTPSMPARATVTVDRASATTPAGDAPLALEGWAPVTSLVREELAAVRPAGAAGFAADLGGYGLPLAVRVLPGGDAGLPPLALTVPAPIAERYDLAPGDESVLTVSGTDLPVRVAAVADVIPGAVDRAAVLADEGALLQHLVRAGQSVPRPGEVWLGAEDDDARGALAEGALELARAQGATDVTVEVAGATRLRTSRHPCASRSGSPRWARSSWPWRESSRSRPRC
ncbi:hypothetical protein [Cellulosimicrobium sp. CUA-896]|uniref:hypothetical protein n=1 Tax=Cellulosimicrobium sp. CUA-896 TaxID=1517881 RepID=UPI001300D6CF|nr:hypothetical protein [Cellulosimicrobium sp. CUA-896]